MKKKKCFIVSYYGVSNAGGVERVCYYVSRIVESKGYNVEIVDKKMIEDFWMSKMIKIVLGRIPLLGAGILSSLYILQKKRKNDIVITNGFNCPLTSADVLFMHGTMKGFSSALGIKQSFKSNIPIMFEKWASNMAKNIIAVSHLAAKEVRQFYNHKNDNFMVVNNMVDENVYMPLNIDREGKLNIVFCGRIERRKGSDRLLQLARYIDDNNINARLIIATNNNLNVEDLEHLKCVSISVGLVQEQLNTFYNKGDVMYFPSRYEGFEMVTLEALTAGVPILGNHVGAVSELSDRKEPGVALIKTPDQPAEILNQLRQLAETYATKDSKDKLHKYYAENYGTEAYISKLEVVFSKINK